MFFLDGKPLAVDVPFVTPDGTRYPANWLRLSTLEEKEAIGITEVPDPPGYDQRFYWGYDQDGNLIPKDHTQLVEQWSNQTRTTANTLLTPSDWMIIREADNGNAASQTWKDWRQSVRVSTGTKITALEATTTTEELAAYVTGPEYSAWPPDPSQPIPPAPVEEPAP